MARTKMRVLVDWDDDGFINKEAVKNAPINLLPDAAFMAALNQTVISSAAKIKATIIQDNDELGLIKSQFILASGDEGHFGREAFRLARPSAEPANVATDFENIPTPLTMVKKQEQSPYGNVVFVGKMGDTGGTFDLLDNAPLGIELKPSTKYTVQLWVKGIMLVSTTNKIDILLQNTAGIESGSKNSSVAGIGAIKIKDYDGSWVQATHIFTTTSTTRFITGLTIAIGGATGTDDDISEIWVTGLKVLEGQFDDTPDQLNSFTDDFDNATVTNFPSTSTPIGTGYANVLTTSGGTNTDEGLQYTIATETETGRIYQLDWAMRDNTGDSLFWDVELAISGDVGGANVVNNIFGAAGDWETGVAFIGSAKGTSTGVDQIRIEADSNLSTGIDFDVAFVWTDITDILKEYYTIDKLFNEQNSPFVLKANTAYRLSFSYKSDDITSATFTANRAELETKTEVQLSSSAVTVGVDWAKEDISIPSVSYNSTWEVVISSAVGTLDIKGVMLVEGTSIAPFSAGATPDKDNITDFLLTADWQLGRNNYDDPLAYEGTATLVMNNDSKEFSPANTASGFSGLFRQNLKIIIEVEDSSNVWVRMWTGWTHLFDAIPGKRTQRRATLTCRQGLFRFREGDLDYQIKRNISMIATIQEIISSVGFKSAYSPYQTILNFKAVLGRNTLLQSVSSLFSEATESGRTLEVPGLEWGRKTNPEQAIKELLKAEHAKMWIDRDGGIVVRQREGYINQTEDAVVNLDKEVLEATYRWGEDIVNRVDVFVTPRKNTTDAEIWRTKAPIEIRGHPFGDARQVLYTKLIEMQFEFEEGTQRTITDIKGNIQDMTVIVYNRDPTRYNDPTPFVVSASEWAGEVHATVLGNESLRKLLQVRNNLRYRVWIDLTIHGTYVEGGEPATYVVEDIKAQIEENALHAEKIELNAITNEEEAISYARFVLQRKATPIGEFRSITRVARDSATLDRMLQQGIGSVLKISEIQTGEKDRSHSVLGESGSYAAGQELRMTATIARINEQRYFKVGDVTGYGSSNVKRDGMETAFGEAVFSYSKKPAITPEKDFVFRLSAPTEGMLIIGNLDESSWVNRFITGRQYTPTVAWIENPTTPDDAMTNERHQWRMNTVATESNIIGIDRTLRFIEETYNFKVGTTLIRLSADIDYDPANFGSSTDLVARGYVYNVTGAAEETTVFTSATINKASGNLRLGGEFTTIKTDEMDWRLELESFDTDFKWFYFGDLTILHYPSLPTQDLALAPATGYYLTLWASTKYGGSGRVVNIKIIAEDGTKIEDSNMTLPEGLGKATIGFTTVAGKENAHAIIITPTGADDLDLYGIAITGQKDQELSIITDGTMSGDISHWSIIDTPTTHEYSGGRLHIIGDSIGDGAFQTVPKATASSVMIDGNMEAVGVGAWTAGSNATLTKETGSAHAGAKVLRIARSITANPEASQIMYTIGEEYQLKGWARSDGFAIPSIFSDGLGTIWTGTTSTSWQPFNLSFVATETNRPSFFSVTNTGTEYTEWDTMSLMPRVPLEVDEFYEVEFDYDVITGTLDQKWSGASAPPNQLGLSGSGTIKYTFKEATGISRDMSFRSATVPAEYFIDNVRVNKINLFDTFKEANEIQSNLPILYL